MPARPVPPCSSSSRRPAQRYAHALEGYATCGQGSSCCQHRSQPRRLGASSFGAATAQKLPSAHRQATGGRSSASVAQRVTYMTVLGGPKNSGCVAVWDSLCLCVRGEACGIRVNSCGANPRTGPWPSGIALCPHDAVSSQGSTALSGSEFQTPFNFFHVFVCLTFLFCMFFFFAFFSPFFFCMSLTNNTCLTLHMFT